MSLSLEEVLTRLLIPVCELGEFDGFAESTSPARDGFPGPDSFISSHTKVCILLTALELTADSRGFVPAASVQIP